MTVEKHNAGTSAESIVEIKAPTPRVSKQFRGDDRAPDGRLPERRIDGADPDK